jgi:ribosome-binding protein aMBF1 (putative translation factor)
MPTAEAVRPDLLREARKFAREAKSRSGLGYQIRARFPDVSIPERQAAAKLAWAEREQDERAARKRSRFAVAIEHARRKRGLSVEEVAEAAGCRPYVVRRVEGGEPVPDDQAAAVVRAVRLP